METKNENRPSIVTDETLNYLDGLRQSGAVNMFGAGKWVEDNFGVSKADARIILRYWMDTFGQENR